MEERGGDGFPVLSAKATGRDGIALRCSRDRFSVVERTSRWWSERNGSVSLQRGLVGSYSAALTVLKKCT